MDDAVGQGLAVEDHRHGLAVAVGVGPGADLLALDHGAVDVEAAVLHLDLVARQADHALDVVLVLRHWTEHGDVAAVGLTAKDAVAEGHRQRERVFAVAPDELVGDEVVADHQGRLHRGGRDREGLVEEGPEDDRDQQRFDDDDDRIPKLAAAGLCFRLLVGLGHRGLAHLVPFDSGPWRKGPDSTLWWLREGARPVNGERFDDDKGLCHAAIVGDGNVDMWLRVRQEQGGPAPWRRRWSISWSVCRTAGSRPRDRASRRPRPCRCRAPWRRPPWRRSAWRRRRRAGRGGRTSCARSR